MKNLSPEPLPELTFFICGHLPDYRSHWSGRFEDYYALQFFQESTLNLWYGESGSETRFDLEGSGYWWGLSGLQTQFCTANPERGINHRYLTFRGAALTRWRANGLVSERPQAVENGAAEAARFDTLISLTRRTDRWGLLRATNLLEQILLELADARA